MLYELYFVNEYNQQQSVDIGDKIKINGVYITITKEFIEDNIHLFRFHPIEHDEPKATMVEPKSKPIFTTYDGVDLYDNDTTVYGCMNGEHPDSYIGEHKCCYRIREGLNTNYYYWFSSPQARDEWIHKRFNSVKFKHCNYVECVQAFPSSNFDVNECYSVDYLINSKIIKEDDPIISDDYKFKKISEQDFKDYVVDKFKNVYGKLLNWSSYDFFKDNDNHLNFNVFIKGLNRDIIAFDAYKNKWVDVEIIEP
ncbi:MAG: hypothetical protein ACOC2W_01630 [bacterium]